MQYTSRIYLKFNNKENWEKILSGINVKDSEGNTATLFSFKDDFISAFSFFRNGVNISEKELDCEISDFIDEQTTDALVQSLIKVVGCNGIVCADTYSYGGDPVCYETYYIGADVHTNIRIGDDADDHFHIRISDVAQWIGSRIETELSDGEKQYLRNYISF